MGKNKDFKKKKYYTKGSGHQTTGKHNFKTISFGSKGILCTSDKRNQKYCGSESRRLLQEYFEKKYGELETDTAGADESNEAEDLSINDLLQKEIQQAKTDMSSKVTRLWEFTDTKCNAVEFLELNPQAVPMMKSERLSDFLTYIFTSQMDQPPPHIRRMVPLENIFQATENNLKAEIIRLAKDTVDDVVNVQKKQFTFKLEFKHRNNTSLDFDASMRTVCEALNSIVAPQAETEASLQSIEEKKENVNEKEDDEKKEEPSPTGKKETETSVPPTSSTSASSSSSSQHKPAICLDRRLRIDWSHPMYVFVVEILGVACGVAFSSFAAWTAAHRWSFDVLLREKIMDAPPKESPPADQPQSSAPPEEKQDPFDDSDGNKAEEEKDNDLT